MPRDEKQPGAEPFLVNRHIAPEDRVGFNKLFLVDLNKDLGEATNVADKHPDVVDKLLTLAENMRKDLGDFDRVGTNMRFLDRTDPRPMGPRKPKPRKQLKKTGQSKK